MICPIYASGGSITDHEQHKMKGSSNYHVHYNEYNNAVLHNTKCLVQSVHTHNGRPQIVTQASPLTGTTYKTAEESIREVLLQITSVYANHF